MARYARSFLTKRFFNVLAFMFLVFVFCYYLDGMKCKREKHARFCFGQAIECGEHELWCEDLVENRAAVQSAATCQNKGLSTLLVHVVEAGPRWTTASGSAEANLAQVMTEVMSTKFNLSQSGIVAETDNADVLFSTPYTKRILNDTNMHPVFYHLRLNNSIRFSSDVVRFAPHSRGSLEDAVTSAVPSVLDSFSLRKYFPNLETALENVRKSSTGSSNGDAGDNSGCNVFNMVVYVVLNVGYAERAGSEARDALLTLRRTLARFLSRKKRYNTYLNSVWFICIPVNGPSHFFEGKPPEAVLPKAASVAEVNRLKKQLCAKNTLSEQIMCEASCSSYQMASSELSGMSKTLSTYFNGSLETTTRTILLPYTECYNAMSKEKSVITEYFEDCTHLTKNGLARLAKCLLA